MLKHVTPTNGIQKVGLKGTLDHFFDMICHLYTFVFTEFFNLPVWPHRKSALKLTHYFDMILGLKVFVLVEFDFGSDF